MTAAGRAACVLLEGFSHVMNVTAMTANLAPDHESPDDGVADGAGGRALPALLTPPCARVPGEDATAGSTAGIDDSRLVVHRVHRGQGAQPDYLVRLGEEL